jgi:hypothetical protein
MRSPTFLSERGVHPAGCGIAHVGQDVGVGIQGEAYIGVPQELLDELWVYALPEQERRARVPKVVETERLRQGGSLGVPANALLRFGGLSERS